MIVTLLFSVNPDAAFAVTMLEACPLFKPEEDDLGLLAVPEIGFALSSRMPMATTFYVKN